MHLRKLMNKDTSNKEGKKFYTLKEKDLVEIFLYYDKLIRKYSTTVKGFDYDLYSECKIAFFKCIRRFEFNEDKFRKIFYSYIKV